MIAFTPRRLGSVQCLPHRSQIFPVKNDIQSHIGLDSIFPAYFRNPRQIVRREVVRRMRAHIQVANPEIDGVRPGPCIAACRHSKLPAGDIISSSFSSIVSEYYSSKLVHKIANPKFPICFCSKQRSNSDIFTNIADCGGQIP